MQRVDQVGKAVFWVLAGVAALSTMDACVKWFVSDSISAVQIIAIRGWFIISVLLLSLPRQGGLAGIKTERPLACFIYALGTYLAPLCFFTALKYLPLTTVTAIFFCSAFFATGGSRWFLGEHVGVHRWVAVIVGFVGILIITKPGSEAFDPASLYAIGSGAAYAFSMLMVRKLSETEPVFRLVFYFNSAAMLISTLLLPWFWVDIGKAEWLGMLIIAGLALSGHLMMTRAFSLASASLLVPYEYTSLIWAMLFGYMIWADIPASNEWLGIAIIVLSGLYIYQRERRLPT